MEEINIGSFTVERIEHGEQTTEGQFLEMAEHCKNTVEKYTHENDLLKKSIFELHKFILSTYGVVRVLDNIIDLQCPMEVNLLGELLRSLLSDYVEKQIMRFRIDGDD
jgi:hypothetical protein